MMYQHEIERLGNTDPKDLTNLEISEITNWNRDFFPIDVRLAAIEERKRREETICES